MIKKTFLIPVLLLLWCISLKAQEQVSSYSLSQLIDSALQNNYILKANEKRLAIKQSEIDLLRLTYQPKISADASASVWKFLLPNKQRLLGDRLTDVYTDITVYQTIYEWGENRIKKAAVDDEIALTGEIERQLRSTIVWGVSDTYFNLLKAGTEVEVHRNTLEQLKSHLKYAEALYNIGKVSGVDLLKINVQIAVEEKAIQKAENSWSAHLTELRRLCLPGGEVPFTVRDHSDSLFLSNQLLILYPDSLYRQTLENHPSIRAANLEITLEEKQKEIARLQNRPEIYSYGISTWEHGYIPFGDNFNYNIGVGLHYTIPLFAGSGFKTKMVQSDLRVDEMLDKQKQLYLDLIKEIDWTINQIEDIRSEISNNQKIIKLARETLGNASVRYQAGQGSIIDVLDAQSILSETTISWRESTLAFLQALAKLRYLTGDDTNPF